jgi:hypothetical protein
MPGPAPAVSAFGAARRPGTHRVRLCHGHDDQPGGRLLPGDIPSVCVQHFCVGKVRLITTAGRLPRAARPGRCFLVPDRDAIRRFVRDPEAGGQHPWRAAGSLALPVPGCFQNLADTREVRTVRCGRARSRRDLLLHRRQLGVVVVAHGAVVRLTHLEALAARVAHHGADVLEGAAPADLYLLARGEHLADPALTDIPGHLTHGVSSLVRRGAVRCGALARAGCSGSPGRCSAGAGDCAAGGRAGGSRGPTTGGGSRGIAAPIAGGAAGCRRRRGRHPAHHDRALRIVPPMCWAMTRARLSVTRDAPSASS